MSIYTSLNVGVSGINAQGNKFNVLSDNIANVNTVGYKETRAEFETLIASNSAATYSPGGVQAGSKSINGKQGELVGTTSPTDIGVIGNGLMPVSNLSTQGDILYTRAGSFSQDLNGDFVNSAGFFLQGWRLDATGTLAAALADPNVAASTAIAALQTVNVRTITDPPSATTDVTMHMNLNAAQVAFLGAGGDAILDANDTDNFGIAADDIIVPTAVDSIVRGDSFTVSTGAGANFTYTYGGFTFGRSVTNAAIGDNPEVLLSSPTTLGNNPITTIGGGSGVVSINQVGHGLKTGDVVTLSGVAGPVGNITAGQLTGSFVVTVTGVDDYTITTAGSDAGAPDVGGGAAVVAVTRPEIGNILDAQTINQTFLGTTGTAGFSAAGLTFTITTAATGTQTFTYKAVSPNAQLGQFSNMLNLADAIDTVAGLTARVVGGRLYVGADDANAAVTFANGAASGSGLPGSALARVDWLRELGLADIAAGANRFSSLQSLADAVDQSAGLEGTVNSPFANAHTLIQVDDPLDTITFADTGTNTGSLVAALGLGPSLNSGPFVAQTVGPTGPGYDPTNALTNMTSGAIQPHFNHPINVVDSTGALHVLNMAFLKTGINSWSVEIYAQPDTDVTTPTAQVAAGTLTFNGDGTLASVDPALSAAITIPWSTTGAAAGSITVDWGTAGPIFGTVGATIIGLADGVSQFDEASDVTGIGIQVNGFVGGTLTGVEITDEGFVAGSFSDGNTRNLFQIPLVTFVDTDFLQSLTGNVFKETLNTSPAAFHVAGTGGAGTFKAGFLESSTVDLASQLTEMIIAQRAYQANTKTILTTDEMLQTMTQLLS